MWRHGRSVPRVLCVIYSWEVDGKRIATELDHITLVGCQHVDERREKLVQTLGQELCAIGSLSKPFGECGEPTGIGENNRTFAATHYWSVLLDLVVNDGFLDDFGHKSPRAGQEAPILEGLLLSQIIQQVENRWTHRNSRRKAPPLLLCHQRRKDVRVSGAHRCKSLGRLPPSSLSTWTIIRLHDATCRAAGCRRFAFNLHHLMPCLYLVKAHVSAL
mmetsp:Transcript_45218/g.107620  ORF Transcript_45218/g.107620 Transcript_45218/m.107620 type:complete len:217 (+) Transcript_45218:2824-3474(+)